MKKLSLIDKAFFLRKLEPFKSLNLDVLLPIADKLVVAPFDKGHDVFSEGDEAHRMYFVTSGTLELVSRHGRRRLLQDHGYFGEEGLFNEAKRSYSVRCLSDCQLLTLSRTNLLSIIAESPAIALGFLQVYATMLPDRSCKEE